LWPSPPPVPSQSSPPNPVRSWLHLPDYESCKPLRLDVLACLQLLVRDDQALHLVVVVDDPGIHQPVAPRLAGAEGAVEVRRHPLVPIGGVDFQLDGAADRGLLPPVVHGGVLRHLTGPRGGGDPRVQPAPPMALVGQQRRGRVHWDRDRDLHYGLASSSASGLTIQWSMFSPSRL